jgi:cytochrome oxidase Cu insertion factor (SCO1/SenC/PrrC family)
MVGLTGPYDDVKKACKVYRVYFSTPKDVKPTDDYLVDHSILSVTAVVFFDSRPLTKGKNDYCV